jgi:hypothetical protein
LRLCGKLLIAEVMLNSDQYMKRWKKIVLIVLAVIVVSQLPFACRRYKLGRFNAAIQKVNSQRIPNQNASDFTEYKGVIHVHSFLGGHSTGTFEEIIAAANANQLKFVIMTEHPSQNFDTSAMTLKGVHAGVLFVDGNEVATASQDRFLVMPGDETAALAGSVATQDFLSQEKAKKALAFVAYPQEFKSWNANDFDGVEVYNVFTNAQRINALVTFFDGLWSYRSYPDLLFATFYARPSDALKKWDEAIARQNRKLVAIAGNDAHSNIGISLNDSSGKTLLGIKLDPYERSFRLVRMHVLVPKDKMLTSETLLSALRDGHCFIAFDLFGDASGFSFSATSGGEKRIQGDEISLGSGVRLTVSTPVSSRIVLIKNGKPVQEQIGVSSKEFAVNEKGVYRVEVYLPQLGKLVSDQPWIISNPIYVR